VNFNIIMVAQKDTVLHSNKTLIGNQLCISYFLEGVQNNFSLLTSKISKIHLVALSFLTIRLPHVTNSEQPKGFSRNFIFEISPKIC
jgi:hypothetical protein